jgi:hypothetical protein
MSNLVMALLISVGAGAWIFSKMARRSGGGNTKPAIIGASVVAVILFIILLLTFSTYLNK